MGENGITIAQYEYDALNHRVKKNLGTTVTLYNYDLTGNLIAETTEDGTPLRDYIYLDGQPFALNVYEASEAGLYFFINDHLGTPQRLVTSTGETVWRAAYLPYGEAQVTVGTVSNNMRFPGQYFDSETGLHYNWHRFYDPATGRYISADPIGLDGGINLYAYVGGNPVNWIDPWGLEAWYNRSYSILILDRGWGDLGNLVDTKLCKHRQKTWEDGYQKCIDQLERDLDACENDPCPEQCKERAKKKFRLCIQRNNDNNGVNYPNARCFWKGYGDYYK